MNLLDLKTLACEWEKGVDLQGQPGLGLTESGERMYFMNGAGGAPSAHGVPSGHGMNGAAKQEPPPPSMLRFDPSVMAKFATVKANWSGDDLPGPSNADGTNPKLKLRHQTLASTVWLDLGSVSGFG